MAKFPRTNSSFACLHLIPECYRRWDGLSRRACTEHTNPDSYRLRTSSLGCISTISNMSKQKTNNASTWCEIQKILLQLTLTSSEAKDWEGQENLHHNYKHQRYAHRLLRQDKKACRLLQKEIRLLFWGDNAFQDWALYGHTRPLRQAKGPSNSTCATLASSSTWVWIQIQTLA